MDEVIQASALFPCSDLKYKLLDFKGSEQEQCTWSRQLPPQDKCHGSHIHKKRCHFDEFGKGLNKLQTIFSKPIGNKELFCNGDSDEYFSMKPSKYIHNDVRSDCISNRIGLLPDLASSTPWLEKLQPGLKDGVDP